MKKNNTKFGTIIGLAITASIAWLVAVVYVLYHFITKFW